MNRKLLAAVVSGALALPMAAQGVEIGASGHVNRALVFSDKGSVDNPKHTDGSASGSRFRFSGSEELDNGVNLGVTLEFAAGGAGGDNPGLRHASFDFSTGTFGKLTIGQTAPATHLIGYANMDSYAWLSGAEIGCDFCTAAGAASTVFTSFGPGRMQVVRYDTPSLGPATLSFSADGNDFWDAALRASGEAGGISYTFHAGYTNYPAGDPTDATHVFVGKPLPDPKPTETVVWWDDNDPDDVADDGYSVYDEKGKFVRALDRSGWQRGTAGHWVFTPAKAADPASKATTLSAAFGLAQGTHFNLTWGQSDPDTGADSEFMHLGIGHNMDDTSVAVTYTDSDIGGGGQSWAIGVGHVIGSTELYAGYKHLNHDAAAMEDYGFFVVGSRVRFN